MTLRASRLMIHLSLLFALAFHTGGAWAAGMETVKIAPDKKGFILHPSGDRYIPWGHNYASVDIMDRLAMDPARVEREFLEMKAAGTSVARIHPEMPRILAGADKADPNALDQLRKLLRIAENSGIHLKITGLACYKIKDRMAWYDSMDEQDRWKTQVFFWESIARTCAESPAVFAYDLVNEPGAAGKRSDGWYMGKMGEVEFCQRLSLEPGKRNGDDIFREWTNRMVAAIRKHDQTHLITMGMLPFPGAYKACAEQLDFVSPHLYPKTGKVDDEIKLLKQFTCLPGQGGAPVGRMRPVLATKRETAMTQELVMQMTAEQAEAFARLNAAAEAGNGSAACRLGDMYREGTGGLRRSPKQAYRCYSRSALAGDARGQNNLGACYEHGIGVAQSYARAAKWYRRAAAQGLGTANMNLGFIAI